MIKSEFIARLAEKYDMVSEDDIGQSVNLILDCISDVLAQGGRAEARGFGSFSVNYRPARLAHNPKTLVKLNIPAKYSVHFKPGKELRSRVNESRKTIPVLQDVDDIS